MKAFYVSCAFAISLFQLCNGYIVEPGPVVKATRGEVWPAPQRKDTTEDWFLIRPTEFKFQAVEQDCEILEYGFQRYWQIIANVPTIKLQHHKKSGVKEARLEGYLDLLEVLVVNPCNDSDLPPVDMDEHYILNITTAGFSRLTANTVWGALRGLETFSQLIHRTPDDTQLMINSTSILDYPRFSFRGVHMDTSRHYIPMDILLLSLDAMSYNKFNVFHWHIVDDHSFPWQSRTFPELSEKGAYHPISKVYTPTDVQTLINYARLRGIRVVPEFDTPGHTRSWGLAIPEILTPCYANDTPTGQFGPINPANNYTYTFLQQLFQEVIDTFPDPYLHLGGDEVGFECWESNNKIKDFMAKMGIAGNYYALESFYMQKLLDIVLKMKAKTIVWEEVFVNGIDLPKETVVHVWRDWLDGKITMKEVTKSGYQGILSSCWYLDHLETGGDWEKFYKCEPFDFSDDPALRSLLIGGEACMWGESVNEHNVVPRMWPRACAAAEKLWSEENCDKMEHVRRRLEEHTCRMNSRGIAAQPPNGPGVCLESNPDITLYMQQQGIPDYTTLESIYIQSVVDMANNLNAQSIVWEEVFNNGIVLPASTIVDVWRPDWADVMFNVTQAGYRSILSACWYLDHLANGGDWLKYYWCEPYDFPGTIEQKELLIGGEACMWAEAVNEYNVVSRMWPRASAVAEKLWSAYHDDILPVKQRLEEHTCRMNDRGIAAQPPNGPGVCL